MRHTALLIVMLALISFPAIAQESPEVEASRKAAKAHNDIIETADEQLAKAIARAQEQHKQRVIAAKERMIEELRRALRIAAQGEEPENSVVIGQQINRLKEQIEALRTDEDEVVEKRPTEKKDVIKGLDPKLVGVWTIVTKSHGTRETMAIFPDGTLYLIKFPGLEREEGSTYQMQFEEGWAFITYTRWGNRRSRFKIEGDDFLHESVNSSGGAYSWKAKVSDWRRSDITDEIRKMAGKIPDNDEGDSTTPQDEQLPETETSEKGNSQHEEVDFFGIPLK